MLIAFLVAAAAASSTSDLRFMIGEWRLEGAFNPGMPNEIAETGAKTCAFAMNGAYVRCDWRMTSTGGRVRELVTYHNYNQLYRRYEHLFIASNWPTKVVGTSGLSIEGEGATLALNFEFTLPDGRVEQLRSAYTYEADRFEELDEIRVAGEEGWRVNTRIVGTRVRS